MLWRILVISTAMLAAFSLTVAELAGGRADFQEHRQYIALGLGVIGLALFAIGILRARKQAGDATEQPPPGAPDARAHQPSLLGRAQYWGPMLLLFGVITFFASPPNLQRIEFLKLSNIKFPIQQIRAAEINPAETGPQVAVIEFPPMRMQGVNASGHHPSVIINTKTYFIGERVGEAVVTAIDRYSATLELAGQTTVLTMKD